jgi:hypothetical protein
MRFLFLLNGVVLGSDVWPAIIHRAKPWDPLHGVAFSFWAALSLLSLLGLRFPVRMLPLLLLQLCYKSIWLIGIAYPLWSGDHWDPVAAEVLKACAIGAILDLIVIPWPYVFENYVKGIFRREAKDEPLAPSRPSEAK